MHHHSTKCQKVVQIHKLLFLTYAKSKKGVHGGSPLTLRPNFNCEKGSVTADKPPVCPAGGVLLMGIYCDSFLCNLRVVLEPYSTSEMRTLFFFCFFFFFSVKKAAGRR